MRNFVTFASILSISILMSAGPADARRRISDGGNVSACAFQTTFGTIPTDGSVSIPIGIYDTGCATTPTQAFSLNIGGTFYNSMFVNENGIVSFGAPITAGPATPLGNLTSPAFAPFFADGMLGDPLSLKYGWTDSSVGFPNSLWLTWDSYLPQGNSTSAPNIFQMGFVDLGAGDFDLIFIYEDINWDMGAIGAQAGVVTSPGNALLLGGAGLSGAYLGIEDISSGAGVCNSATPSTALACNNTNDLSNPVGAIDDNGNPSNGYFLFKFRNGVLLNTPVSEVPIPAAFGLFAIGIFGFASRNLFRKKAS